MGGILVSAEIYVGVDIGGTKTAVVLARDPRAILTRIVFPTEAERGPEPILASLLASIHKALLSQSFVPSDVKAIGVSCGGPLDPIKGMIQEPPNLPGWKDIPILSILKEEFCAPSYLENDANAGALAEYRFGAGVGMRDLIFLTMGTGLGAGLILDGSLYRGVTFSAGEIGHVRLTETGPVGYNKAGSVEGWASGSGMALQAQKAIESARRMGEQSLLAGAGSDDPAAQVAISARDVWFAAQQGDAVAGKIIATVGQKLGKAAAILVDLLNPEMIVIGGLALRIGDAVLEPARAAMRTEALSAAASACRIVPAALGEQIGDVAALCVAMEGLANGK
jgi:glucokinase